MKLVVMIVAGVLLAGCSSSSSGSGGGSGGGGGGAGFVGKVSQNATATATDVSALIAEAAAVDELDESGMTQLAADAQELHGHLNDFHDSLLNDVDSGKSDQVDMYGAEKDLRSAVETLNSWTGDPNASLSAKWQREMGTGIGEWNAAVTALWASASAGSAPTITIPS